MSGKDNFVAVQLRISEEWESLLARDLSAFPNDLTALVNKASRNAKLRGMFPFLSVGRLCFSPVYRLPICGSCLDCPRWEQLVQRSTTDRA